jgi:protein-disulfide isomerase-like protein with CxxC motif
MLSGNGTIVLESIANVQSALRALKLNNTHNSAIISATQQVHHSLGNLIALNKETVKEIVSTLDAAVTTLVNLANEKADASKKNAENDVDQQQINRSSLPDIPLSKKEKAELENSMLIQNSHSSESILHDRKINLLN